ncbi:MAG: hypothetical protein JOY90_03115 [Bradyrhizobium sp.]|uniref:hypothetical protein n=1 Tax=Bradyrhizobium sp. TaxID=376 RepID=UPI001DAB29AD|nr:hypothetical protein [Bradyrhizobium sp.]MBV9559441.1 hypothetical protein [Bradyrhizobium sp.]
MDILAVIIVLQLVLFAAAWSAARSYFARGRLAGMQEASAEIVRGVSSQHACNGRPLPAAIGKAFEQVQSFARRASPGNGVDRCQERLFKFGDAIGAACWHMGYESCQQKMSPRQDRIRLDLPVDELLHLATLAHLGFKKMMPNDRAIETMRFEGEEHAIAVARAVERLEAALPEAFRPGGHAATRHAMIHQWWRPLERRRA